LIIKTMRRRVFFSL